MQIAWEKIMNEKIQIRIIELIDDGATIESSSSSQRAY